MPDNLHDLLVDPVLRIRQSDGFTAAVPLATAMARLSRGDEIEFCGLQAHQEHAWHAFLVQVAAMALHRASASTPFVEAADWRDALRELAGGSEAWCLVVPDLSRPAFFQPPVPEASLKQFSREDQPDDLDVLVTAKNHDVKRSRMMRASTDHWVYLLVTVQTMQGFSGRGNYGVARMNGGFGNRPHVAHAPGLGRAVRFSRDVRACQDGRPDAVGHRGFAVDGGMALLWTEPWDGAASLMIEQLDPWFIECCRRVRLVDDQGRVVAFRRATERARVAAVESKGDTSDPWTPVDRAKGAGLTMSAAGFGYDRTQELLLGAQYTMGAAGPLRADDGPTPWFIASATARGQGRTDGLHQRILRVPEQVRVLLRSTGARDALRDRSRRWVSSAKIAKLNVLGPALSVIVGSGDGSKAARVRFLSAFDAAIDDTFFDRLWQTAEAADTDADATWASHLVAMARVQLSSAIDTAPSRSASRYGVIARAENLMEACARRRFPEAFPPKSRSST